MPVRRITLTVATLSLSLALIASARTSSDNAAGSFDTPLVVKLQGQRDRWFGPGDNDANINSDIEARVVDIKGIAEQDWPMAPDDVGTLITAFTDGWNAHLAGRSADGGGMLVANSHFP